MNEHSFHSEIKKVYSLPGDRFEVKLDEYIVDILRGKIVIEVQTRNFSALKKKLEALTTKYQVRLVYPLPERKWITYITEKNEIVCKRKSPRKGKLTDLFGELVMIPKMIINENFSLEVLFIDEEEVRCDDRRGSWRRRGISIKERRLLQVNKSVVFQKKSEYFKILPVELNQCFTNKELANLARISVRTARQITYCLRINNIIKHVENSGRELKFRKVEGIV